MSDTAPLQNLAAKPQPLSDSTHAGLLLQRKCACGSPTASLTGECEECKSKKRLQTKLTIGASNDPLEQEADRVADQVLAAPVNPAVSGAPPHIQRFTGQPGAVAGTAPASVDRVLTTPGRPLDAALRQDMEERFGHDFSRVRVHSGAAAEQSAQEVNANAYTVGHDIVFGAGWFAPGTPTGRGLLAHELAHVVQQGNGLHPRIQRQLAGCQQLLTAPQVVGVVTGTAVHRAIEAHFLGSVSGATREPIPGASAAPLRSQGLCGEDDTVINPQRGGGKSGNKGFPDLARITPGGIMQVAELKPAALPCLVDGEEQLSRYVDQGNSSDSEQVAWRNSLGIKVVAPMLESAYPPPSPTVGRCQIQTAWCSPGLMAYSASCGTRRRDTEPEPPVQVEPLAEPKGDPTVEGTRPIIIELAPGLEEMRHAIESEFYRKIGSSAPETPYVIIAPELFFKTFVVRPSEERLLRRYRLHEPPLARAVGGQRHLFLAVATVGAIPVYVMEGVLVLTVGGLLVVVALPEAAPAAAAAGALTIAETVPAAGGVSVAETSGLALQAAARAAAASQAVRQLASSATVLLVTCVARQSSAETTVSDVQAVQAVPLTSIESEGTADIGRPVTYLGERYFIVGRVRTAPQ